MTMLRWRASFTRSRRSSFTTGHYETRAEATRDLFAYIEGFYNPIRRHSAIGFISPIEMELKAA